MANKVKWLGHAAFEVATAGGKRILIDPWITGNPDSPAPKEEFKGADLILITHDHFDHLGEDLPFLVEGSDTIIIAQPEVVEKLKEAGIPEKNFIFGMGMNIGGTVETGKIKVTMVQAIHSSAAGSSCGFIISTEDDKKIYHAGDTGIFSGMELLGEIYKIDLALLPIGSVFVMDPLQASFALKLLKPQKVIPMHYKTFPILEQSADEFIRLAKQQAPEVEVIVAAPGEEIEF